VSGVAQPEKAAASSWQSNVAPGLLDAKVNVAVVSSVTAGGRDMIAVDGCRVSTIQLYVAGTGSALPSSSTARTANVWLPSARLESVVGLLHMPKSGVPSSLQNQAAPRLADVKLNVAVVWFVRAAGPEAIAAPGGAVSIVHVTEVIADTFPAASVAVALNACVPGASAVYATGLEHGAGSRASSLHEKVAGASFDASANVALVSFVKDAALVSIDATGGVVSTVQVNDAGAETFPIVSVAVTENE